MTEAEYHSIVDFVCREFGVEAQRKTVDQDCKVVPLKANGGFLVFNHVYRWTETESHLYPISVDRDHNFVVSVRASSKSALLVSHNDHETIEAARNALASLPFSEILTTDVAIEWKKLVGPSMVFINNVRDITHSLPKPFFPLPGDNDDLSRRVAAYIREHVLESYIVETYRCVKAAAMGLDAQYVAVSEGLLFGEGVIVPYSNPHYSSAALTRIEEILGNRSMSNQAKLKRITDLLTHSIEGKAQATYNAGLLTG
jgi:hypothetical protein